MLLMDLTKDDFWTRYGTRQRTLLRPSHFLRVMQNTKSSSLMRLTTQPTMYNSFCGLILRRFITTVDSSSLATTRTRSSNPYTLDVQSLSSVSKGKKKPSWQDPSSSVYRTSWMRKVYNTILKSLQNSSTNISPTGDES